MVSSDTDDAVVGHAVLIGVCSHRLLHPALRWGSVSFCRCRTRRRRRPDVSDGGNPLVLHSAADHVDVRLVQTNIKEMVDNNAK
jgi:hypothetical protein